MLLSRSLTVQLSLWVLAAVLLPAMYTAVERRRSIAGLAPSAWCSWILRTGTDYWVAVIASAALLAPAAAVLWAAAGSALHLQVAVAGPLFAGPVLVVARLLGRFQFRAANVSEIEYRIAKLAADVAASARSRTNPTAAGQPSPRTKRPTPNRKPKTRPAAAAKRPARRAPAPPPATVAEAILAERQRREQLAARELVVAGSGTRQAPTPLEELPSLAQMPGFRVVREAERMQVGASAGGNLRQGAASPAGSPVPSKPRPQPRPHPPAPRRR
jgi:hypothetical protein